MSRQGSEFVERQTQPYWRTIKRMCWFYLLTHKPMTDTDQIIDGICKDLAKQQDMEMYVNISDVRRTLENHLAWKIVLDRSKVEEMIKKYKERAAFYWNRDLVMIIADLQSLLPPNPKQ